VKRAALLLVLVPAVALPCTIHVPAANGFTPAHGSTGVPLNVELRFIPTGSARWALTETAGSPVAVTERRRGRIVALRPEALLAPETQYTLTVTDTNTTESIEVTFTTGNESDTEPPPVPGRPTLGSSPKPLPSPFEGRSTCGSGTGFNKLAWPPTTDSQTPVTGIVIEGAFVEAADDPVHQPEFVVPCSTRDCLLTWVPGESTPALVRARAVDWAGNMSELTEPESVRGCGCSAGDGVAVLLAVALLLRRPR